MFVLLWLYYDSCPFFYNFFKNVLVISTVSFYLCDTNSSSKLSVHILKLLPARQLHEVICPFHLFIIIIFLIHPFRALCSLLLCMCHLGILFASLLRWMPCFMLSCFPVSWFDGAHSPVASSKWHKGVECFRCACLEMCLFYPHTWLIIWLGRNSKFVIISPQNSEGVLLPLYSSFLGRWLGLLEV